jgi:hypothetical protein
MVVKRKNPDPFDPSDDMGLFGKFTEDPSDL